MGVLDLLTQMVGGEQQTQQPTNVSGYMPANNPMGDVQQQEETQPSKNLWQQAQDMYPRLKGHDLLYKESFDTPNRGHLEHWPADETGTEKYQRPKEFPMGKAGLEIFDKNTKPSDAAADYVSHNMVKTDPYLKNIYSKFEDSLKSPESKQVLRDQYSHAVIYEGEDRPYKDWAEQTGKPGYFRGYTFNQWPKEFNDKVYTSKQKNLLDKVNQYLQKESD